MTPPANAADPARPAYLALLERLSGLHPRGIDLSLDRVRRLLASLGHPERRLPPVVHLAGTNGKGSTLAFMRAALEAAGRRVHAYTSPHLVRFNERIRVAGRPIADDPLAQVLAEVEACNAGRPVTPFEAQTAAAVCQRSGMATCNGSENRCQSHQKNTKKKVPQTFDVHPQQRASSYYGPATPSACARVLPVSLIQNHFSPLSAWKTRC